MMNKNNSVGIWTIEDNKVYFHLDEHYKFYIEREEDGFSLKVIDDRGYNHKPNEPILFYKKKISDSQLGYIK